VRRLLGPRGSGDVFVKTEDLLVPESMFDLDGEPTTNARQACVWTVACARCGWRWLERTPLLGPFLCGAVCKRAVLPSPH
jgi:hypothetical protein